MSQQSFEEVLRLARELSPGEQQQLAAELINPPPSPNGAQDGDGEVKTVGDAFRKLGLLGTLTDAPADLATNPKYMEGFGEHAD